MAPRSLLSLYHSLHAFGSIHQSILVVYTGHATAEDSLRIAWRLLAIATVAACTFCVQSVLFMVDCGVNGELHGRVRILTGKILLICAIACG